MPSRDIRERIMDFIRPSEGRILDRLRTMNRFVGGEVRVFGWELAYVDGPSLWSCLDVIVGKRWNDFSAESDSPVIIDCGANIRVSVLNCKRLYPGARIVAFEPDPMFLPVLKSNLARNGAGDVVVVEAAAWTTNRNVPFFCEGANGSRVIQGHESYPKSISVRSVDPSAYLDDPVDLVKMDIEGAEFEVIPHLEKNWASEEPRCGVPPLRQGYRRFLRLLGVLASAGFRIALNSYGRWVDLVRRSDPGPNEFDQYILLVAWRAHQGTGS